MRKDVAEYRGKPAEPSSASVRKQLDRILQSTTFCSAPGLSRFLRHLVEQAIDGNTAPLKEYSVGVEVFDRGNSFDPRIDPAVRISMNWVLPHSGGVAQAACEGTDPRLRASVA